MTKINRQWIGIALMLVLLLGMAPGLVRGIAYADINLDISFSGDGKLNEDIVFKDDAAHAVAVQPDGKIVVVGKAQVGTTVDHNPVLARYNPNGTRDTTFGDGGIVVDQTFGGGEDGVNSIALQPDGKIVVAGFGSSLVGPRFAIGRFNSNGTPDTGFGGNRGTLFRGWYQGCESRFCDENFTAVANGVAIQPDGKIVAAGWINDARSGTDFLLIRVNSNGTLDTSFGNEGRIRTAFFDGVDEVRAIAIQPDGKIVVAGNAQVSGNNYDFALARYTADGKRQDIDFGNRGKSTLDFGGGDDGAYGMALQPDGKIVVVGSGRSASEYNFAMARFQANGALDSTFLRGAGKLSLALGTAGTTDEGRGVVVQPDGKIVAVGYSNGGATGNNFAVFRFMPIGDLDPSFDRSRQSSIDFAAGADVANAAALQPDGQLVVVGSAVVRAGNGSDLAIARILTNANPPPTPALTPAPKGTLTPTAPPTNSRFFAATGHTVRGLFLKYWDEHGGLAQQGFPITEELQEISDTDGKTYTMQYFERAVFEHHPENSPPFDVLLSLIGTFYYEDKYGGNAPNQRASTINPRKFAETGKTLGGTFRKYWETHGGLAQQGFPISDEFQEVSQTDGKTYTVQYFQRAVFELHPEFAGTPSEVLLSLLGVFFHDKKHGGEL